MRISFISESHRRGRGARSQPHHKHSSGIDQRGIDLMAWTARWPGDDFFRFWHVGRTTPIPESSLVGVGAQVAEHTSTETRELLEAATRARVRTRRKVGDLRGILNWRPSSSMA